MHIAIEGMDGAGKTSQAKAVAKRLNCEFIAKSFHEMNDPSGRYDNFVTINEYTNGNVGGVYGLRQNYFMKKIRNENFVTDRFYISNYWSRADELGVDYFENISMVWGIPDIIIILFAKPEVLYKRIHDRNPNDKDLWKPQYAEKAYSLMFDFAKKMNLSTLVVDTSELEFDDTTNVILYAKEYGINECVKKFSKECSLIVPEIRIIRSSDMEMFVANNRLLYCTGIGTTLELPKDIECISDKAFCRAKSLEELIIPESIKEISELAFDNSNINQIIVDNANPIFSEKNGMLIENSKVIYFCGDNITVRIPDYINEIGNRAFANSQCVEEIVIDSAMERIGYGAFVDCKNLKSIIIGNNVKKISSGCFLGCDMLRSIEIETKCNYYTEDDCIKDKDGDILFFYGTLNQENVYEIKNTKYVYPYAFYSRVNAEKLLFDGRTCKIGSFAFENCNIHDIVFTGNICDIGEKAFYGCDVKKIEMHSEVIPEIWNNTFDGNPTVLLHKLSVLDYIQNKNWRRMKLKQIVGHKLPEELCGAACINYIMQKENDPDTLDPNAIWIMQLALFLHEYMPGKISLIYNQSQLMNDFYQNLLPDNTKMHLLISEFMRTEETICEQEVVIEDLTDMVKKSRWIILLEKSDVFFNDINMEGQNHFVIVQEVYEDQAIVISPGKTELCSRNIDISKIIQGISNNGQWILRVDVK